MPDTKASLLIVDDQPLIRDSLALVLTEIGWCVRTAFDGFSALAEIHKEIPEVLLSDLNMPGMSGFDLLMVVRRMFPAIRTVAMSGAFSGDEVPSGVAADAFYQKGCSLGSLLMILEALPQMERRAFQPRRPDAPLWIHRNGNDALGKPPVTITCPECHRTAPLALDGFGSMMREINCVFCGNSIQYRFVESSQPTMPQGFQLDAPVANSTQNTSAANN